MVFEAQQDYPTQWGAIVAVAEMIGCSSEALRLWVRQTETDTGGRSGLTSSERQRLRELEKENRELRRANEILKRASAFFAAELDRPQK
jgi:transposase